MMKAGYVVDLTETFIPSLQKLWVSTPTSTLWYLLVSLVPPVATFLYFWALEYWKKVPGAGRIWIWIVILSASYAIWFPPELPGYLSIICGPGSVIHIIRAVEFAFVLDVPQLKRLRRETISSKFVYVWEPYPQPLTISRGVWLIDLMTSIRGIGWNHGPRNLLPPTSLNPQRSNPQNLAPKGASRFLIQKGSETILCYLWIDLYQSIIIRSNIWHLLDSPGGWRYSGIQHNLLSWLLTPWVKWIPTKICIYATIQLSCSILAFVDIGIGLLGNETWHYAPIFGSSIGVMRMDLQAIWGEWWHNLFRLTFLGIADWVIRTSKASEARERVLVLSVPFVFYSAIHASLSYSISHDAVASTLVVIFGAVQPLVISAQVRLRSSVSRKKKMLHDLIGLAFLLNTFGLLLGNPGVLHSLASFPIPISVWRKGAPDGEKSIVS